MKKKPKKMVLAKETLRNLEQAQLGEAAAAGLLSYGGTACVACGSGITTCGPYECQNACIEP